MSSVMAHSFKTVRNDNKKIIGEKPRQKHSNKNILTTEISVVI